MVQMGDMFRRRESALYVQKERGGCTFKGTGPPQGESMGCMFIVVFQKELCRQKASQMIFVCSVCSKQLDQE